MISEAYRQVLCATRAASPQWGGSRRHAPIVAQLLEGLGYLFGTLLDFGAGNRTFAQELERVAPGRYGVVNYDPSTPGFDVLPAGRYLAVVCTHVLEHVEPELLEQTLAEIRERAEHMVYIEVPHGPAVKVLTDGRNAHLIQESAEWWYEKLRASFAGSDVHNWPGANPRNTVFVIYP